MFENILKMTLSVSGVSVSFDIWKNYISFILTLFLRGFFMDVGFTGGGVKITSPGLKNEPEVWYNHEILPKYEEV